jgi:hypothetical protein
MPSNGHLPPVPTRAELEAAGIRIVVGVPLERTVPDVAFLALWKVAQRGWPLFEIGYGRVDVNRNKMARKLLDSDYTHLMMLDLDQIHAPDIVERQARWVLDDPQRQVISGLHFRRGEPFDPLMFLYGPDGQARSMLEWPQGLIEVHAVGHGSLLVQRSVFEQLAPPWWGYDYGQAAEGVYPTEDMYFCWLCREAGIALWCDTTTSSPHLINNVVTEEVFRSWIKAHPDKILIEKEA